MTPARREATMIRRSLCSLLLLALFVVCAQAQAQTNNRPVSHGNTIYVPVGGSYTFSAGDFPFTDADGAALHTVQISTIPANGGIALAGAVQPPVAFNISSSLLNNGSLVYTPSTNATTAMASYTSFMFNVWTGPAESSISNATMTIDLVQATASPATGAPTVTAASGAAYNEDVELTASATGIADANGIPTHTRSWQWQQSATQAGTYAAIAGATAATFTPLSAHIGQYIRVCFSFTDGIGTPEMLCTTGTGVFNALRLRLRLFLEGPLR